MKVIILEYHLIRSISVFIEVHFEMFYVLQEWTEGNLGVTRVATRANLVSTCSGERILTRVALGNNNIRYCLLNCRSCMYLITDNTSVFGQLSKIGGIAKRGRLGNVVGSICDGIWPWPKFVVGGQFLCCLTFTCIYFRSDIYGSPE